MALSSLAVWRLRSRRLTRCSWVAARLCGLAVGNRGGRPRGTCCICGSCPRCGCSSARPRRTVQQRGRDLSPKSHFDELSTKAGSSRMSPAQRADFLTESNGAVRNGREGTGPARSRATKKPYRITRIGSGWDPPEPPRKWFDSRWATTSGPFIWAFSCLSRDVYRDVDALTDPEPTHKGNRNQ
jgi:hypothetical protein